MKIAKLLVCLIIGFTVNAQVTNFDELEVQINSATVPYEAIRKGADSLFNAWHAANPNDTGLAPLEKKFIRWKSLAQSRAYIVGQPSTTSISLKANMASAVGLVGYCDNGPSENQWVSIGPNPQTGDVQAHGIINALAVHPSNESIIYAGSEYSGLYKTTDGGQNWTNVTDSYQLPGLGVVAVAIDPLSPNVVLAGTHSQSFGYPGWLDYSTQGIGMLRSTNGGASWSVVNFPTIGGCARIDVIRFNPQNPNTVFAAGACGIYKSTNNGVSWTQVYDNSADPILKKVHFIDLEIGLADTSMICASTIKTDKIDETVKAARVFCSNDGGATFLDRTPPKACLYTTGPSDTTWYRAARSIALDISPADSSNIYAFFGSRAGTPVVQSATLYKTSDGGQTWIEHYDHTGPSDKIVTEGWQGVNWGRYRYQFELSNVDVNKVYLGGNKMYTKNLQSDTNAWNPITEYLPVVAHHADIRAIINRGVDSLGNDRLYIANDGGVSKTFDGGASWVDLSGNGLSISQIHGFASWPYNDRVLMGAMHNGFHLFSGSTRRLFNSIQHLNVDGGFVLPEPGNDNVVYAHTNGGLHRCVLNASGNRYSSVINLGVYTDLKMKFDGAISDSVYIYYADKGLINDTVYVELSRYNATSLKENVELQPRLTQGFSTIKVAPSDPEVVFAAVFEPCWNCTDNGGNVSKKLYKKQNGQWNDLSPSLRAVQDSSIQYLDRCYIEDLVIDPMDANRVWVGMAYYDYIPGTQSGRNRVFYSDDGGLSWSDQSNGLPPYPVNCLTYQEGSDDVIYAGTDAGVYYWDKQGDNGNGKWECFNNGLPAAIITKIDVHPCRGVVIASTFGRSMWQSPMVQSKGEYHVTSSTTWGSGSTHQFISDLIVDAGAILTISGTVEFAPGSRLVIKPGARVNLDGGELTAYDNCGIGDLNWEGVQVYGVPSQSQYGGNHGVLFVSNGGVISHARTAVSNVGWNDEDFLWGTQGGVISAVGATFLNNRRDLQFVSFHNHWYGSKEWDYQADFINCTFSRDNNYRMAEPYAAVTMWDVNGVEFLGCTFTNEVTAFPNSGYGIYALGAQFEVDKRLGPTGGNDSTRFEGYNYAIYATNVNRADRFTSIANSSFSDNKHGVYLSNHSNAKVVSNRIKIPDVLAGSSQPALYGFYFDASTGYSFMQNEVIGRGTNYPKVGAVFHNNGSAANLSYKNSFDKLTYGTEAIGNNKGTGEQGGLLFKCNNYGENTDNANDIVVWVDQSNSFAQGIAANQGYFDVTLQDPTSLANNLFSQYQQDIYNEQGAYKFNYYYSSGGNRYEPTAPYNITGIDVFFGNYVYNTVCPNKVDNTGAVISGDLTAELGELGASEGQLSGKRSLYTQLLNGGNTAELEAEILFAGQSEYQDLYVELMQISPYVDEGQLIDLINNSGFPELALRNVLVANPHSGRSPDVMTALVERSPAVSQQTILDVENGSQTITAKDVIEAEMAALHIDIAINVRNIQNFYITDSIFWDTDSLVNLFSARKEAEYVFMLAEYYANKGEYTNVTNTLESADQTWWSESDMSTLSGLQLYYSYLEDVIVSGDGLSSLSNTAKQNLQNLRDNTESAFVWQKSNGVLSMLNLGDDSYIEPVYLAPSFKNQLEANRPEKPSSTFSVFPNPASDYIEVHWDWFEEGIDGDLELKLFSVNGQLIKLERITDYGKNIWVLNTVGIVPGMYIVNLSDNEGNSLFEQKISLIN